MKKLALFLRLITVLALLAPIGSMPKAAKGQDRTTFESPRAETALAYSSGGLLFVENMGQFDPGARFQVTGGQYAVFLADDGIWLTLLQSPSASQPTTLGRFAPATSPEEDWAEPSPIRGVNLHLTYSGANPQPRIEGFNRQQTVVSYFLGSDPSQWHPDVPGWGGVRYVDIYPGVDLEVTGSNGRFSQRFVVKDEDTGLAALRQAKLKVEGAVGLAMEGDASLSISTEVGTLALGLARVEMESTTATSSVDQLPRVDDVPAAIGMEVLFPFTQANLSVFAPYGTSALLGASDLLYSTYLGGNNDDDGLRIAVDAAGNAYVTGQIRSSNFSSTPGSFQSVYGGGTCIYYGTYPCPDAFTAKINTTTGAPVFISFLGGNGSDVGSGIAVDSEGNAYVVGSTSSANFPVTAGAFDTTYGGGTCGTSPNTYPCPDAFVAKINASGTTLVYATYLGGGHRDALYGIAIDEAGNSFIAGFTTSSDFPITQGAFQTSIGGSDDAFVAKLDPTGSNIVYATFLGGVFNDPAFDIAIDGSGSAYVTGYTTSSNFPTTPGAYDRTYGGGSYPDGYIAKLNPSGSALSYSTFLGGSGQDFSYGIALDDAGNAYSVGDTMSTDFPTTSGAFQRVIKGGNDVFASKLDASGSTLLYSTLLGGSNSEQAFSIAIDDARNTYIVGHTSSTDFPVTEGAFQTTNRYLDVFAVRLNTNGTELVYSTFVGGNQPDGGRGIAYGKDGMAYITGWTRSADFPTTPGAIQATYGGGTCVSGGVFPYPCDDAILVKLSMEPPPPPPDFALTATPGGHAIEPGQTATFTITVQPINGFTNTVTLTPPAPPPSATLSLSPLTLGPAESASLIVTDTNTAPLPLPLGYPVSITGSGGGITRTVIVGVVISGTRIHLPVVFRGF